MEKIIDKTIRENRSIRKKKKKKTERYRIEMTEE
jgi:hypothetical protein